jgi:hypothetical protein
MCRASCAEVWSDAAKYVQYANCDAASCNAADAFCGEFGVQMRSRHMHAVDSDSAARSAAVYATCGRLNPMLHVRVTCMTMLQNLASQLLCYARSPQRMHMFCCSVTQQLVLQRFWQQQ